MNEKPPDSGNPGKLRSRAEAVMRASQAEPSGDQQPLAPEDAQRIIHELHVHQLELKMQNEELSRVQAELEVARAHYFDLYHLAPIGYCILSLDGLVMEANFTAVNMLDLALSTLVRQPITKFIFKDDQDIYYLHRKRLYETHRLTTCELRMLKKDGSSLWVQLTSSPFESGPEKRDGSASRLVVSDITERKSVQEENARLLAQLQATRQPLGKFRRQG